MGDVVYLDRDIPVRAQEGTYPWNEKLARGLGRKMGAKTFELPKLRFPFLTEVQQSLSDSYRNRTINLAENGTPVDEGRRTPREEGPW